MLNSLDKSNANFNAKIHLVSTWYVTATTNFQAHKIVKEAEESTFTSLWEESKFSWCQACKSQNPLKSSTLKA